MNHNKVQALIVAVTCTCLVACNEQKPDKSSMGAVDTTVIKPAAVAPVATAKTKTDPVCSMPVEAEWTELTVYMGDTVRFCSENCKGAFEARPKKYAKNIMH